MHEIGPATPEELPGVEELEQTHADNPADQETEFALAEALLERFLYESGEAPDLDRLEEIVKRAPADKLRYERAYLALLDANDASAAHELRQYAARVSTESADSPGSDELWDWIGPLLEVGAGNEVLTALAEGLEVGWPDSAAIRTLRGLAEADHATSVSFLSQALQQEPSYWLAAYALGDRLFENKDWAAAGDAFRIALKSEGAAELPEMHFSLAWCAGKLGDHAEEAAAYRACLALDPDYKFARNNLGWSLLKSGAYEEAVSVLRQAVEEGHDGKLPLRNLSKALEGLGRYDEAIEMLERDTHRDKITASSQRRIEKLRLLKDRGTSHRTLGTELEGELEDHERRNDPLVRNG